MKSATRKSRSEKIGVRQQQVDAHRREQARTVRACGIDAFHQQMKDAGVYRAYVVFENGVFTLSHPDLLEPIQAFFELSQDFAAHEGVFIGREDGVDSLFFAFVHDTRRGLAQGGLRFWRYDTLADVLVDGLRLAQGMTRKNALAGLWWGGGKGIITLPSRFAHPNEFGINTSELTAERRRYFEAYGRFVASLGGVYYTAEDVGTFTADMEALLSQNRFTSCIPPAMGGSGNPSPFTARGVFRATAAAWHFLGRGELAGARVTVQGAGNVGRPLIRELHQAGAELWIADINRDNLAAVKEELPAVHLLDDPEAIFDQPADIFAPCARGAVVNLETIPRLKAAGVVLVCGAANNILKEPGDADRLRENGIAYVPDYLCNRMGIVNCADEWMGYIGEDVQVAAERVYPDTLRVFKHGQNLMINTARAADHLADISAADLNPFIGHRGRRLIDRLIHSDWAHAAPNGEPRTVPAAPRDAFDPSMDEEEIRHRWHSAGVFSGRSPAICTAPISTAGPPDLAGFMLPVLLDVRIRAMRRNSGLNPRRLLGCDHGGLSLQNAVERATPRSREAIGRAEFQEMCRDFHSRNDSAIRRQLNLLGVGHDPAFWLDPFTGDGPDAVAALFNALNTAGLVEREDYFSYHHPTRGTVLVNQDVAIEATSVRYTVTFPVEGDDQAIDAHTFMPELVLGAVAVAVHPDGPWGSLDGGHCRHPLTEQRLSIVRVDDLDAPARFLVPAHSSADDQIARRLGIRQRIAVYDGLGNVNPALGLSVSANDIRDEIIRRLGDHIRQEIGTWNVPRCARTNSLVVEGISDQLFVKLVPMKGHLLREIETGGVTFNRPGWREHALRCIEEFDRWCISRQHWWGNPVPIAPNREVLSSWFSMAAQALQGAGWPHTPIPEPIEEVLCTPQFLERWVLPAQLVSVAVTGQPLFRRVTVYGTPNAVHRQLQEVEGATAGTPDEERFVMRSMRVPMKNDSGHRVQPEDLIRRYGADALRLGYLLCVDRGEKQSLTLAESQLRLARKTIKLLSSKVGGILQLTQGRDLTFPRTLLDDWLLAHLAEVAGQARRGYAGDELQEVGALFVATVERFKQYLNIAARRRKGQAGSLRRTTLEALHVMDDAFAPICPYLFEKLSDSATRLGIAREGVEAAPGWLPELVEALFAARGERTICAPDPLVRERLEAGKGELERLTRVRLTVTGEAADGVVMVAGPCLVIAPGDSAVPDGSDAVLAWYRKQRSARKG